MRLVLAFLFALSLGAQQEVVSVRRRPGAVAASCPGGVCTGLAAWYESDSGLTCTGGCSDGNAVTAWADKSSNTNNLSCPSAPTYLGNQINSLPAVNFARNPDYCTFGSSISIGSGMTIFAVLKNKETYYSSTLVSGQSGSVAYWTCKGGPKEQGLDNPGVAELGKGNAGCDTSWHQVNMAFTPSTGPIDFRLGRSGDGSPAATSSITNGLNSVGVNNYDGNHSADGLNAHVAAIIIYNAKLSGTDITTVETYLNGKYGI